MGARNFSASVAVIALLGAASGAHAQSAPADGSAEPTLDDIVVTAQKREETLQRTPLAVTAVSGEELERRQVSSVEDLGSVAPGVSIGQHAGSSRVYIRGVGNSSTAIGQDTSIAMHIDGVVIGRPTAQLSSFFDLERIEVVRGPQGTLYGRNATGGAINLISRKPTRELSGYATLSYGNYDLRQFEGAISGPLDAGGSVRARIAMQRIKRDGYGRNVTLEEDVNDQDSWAIRASLEADIARDVELALTADYAREDDHNYAILAFGPYRSDTPLTGLLVGGNAIFNSQDVASDVSVVNDRKIWGLSGTLKADLGNGFRLQSITGYRAMDRLGIQDLDNTSATIAGPLIGGENSKQFTQELQLLYSSDRAKGVFGLYYYDESLRGKLNVAFPFLGAILGFPAADYREEGDLKIKAYAAFGQLSYEVVPDVNLTAGLRYNHEKRVGNGTFTSYNFLPAPNGANLSLPIDQERSWAAVTPKFGIDYSPSEDLMVYASVTRGFKSGTVNFGSPNPPVDPEYVWAYEGGLKSRLLNDRLEVNLAGFYYDYTNLQVTRAQNNTLLVLNAASARIKGLEIATRARPARGVSINLDATYLDTKFGDFITENPSRPELGTLNLNGNRLVNSPSLSVNLGAEVDLPVGLPGALSLRSDVQWTSKLYFNEFNDDQLSQPENAMVDASLRYDAPAGWNIELFTKNLTDAKVASTKFAAAAAFGYPKVGILRPPRTYGVRVGFSF